jgi:hypothetical protein
VDYKGGSAVPEKGHRQEIHPAVQSGVVVMNDPSK